MTREIGLLSDWTAAMERATRDGVALLEARATTEGLTATVCGSTGARYRVATRATAAGVDASCDCPAGQRGLRCKHVAVALARMGYLDGPAWMMTAPRRELSPDAEIIAALFTAPPRQPRQS